LLNQLNYLALQASYTGDCILSDIVYSKANYELAVLLQDINVTISSQVVIESISCGIGRAEHWAVLGPNGAGKSTLAEIITATRHPTSGKAFILGQEIGRVDVRQLRRRIGVVGSRLQESLPYAESALSIVATGAENVLAPWWMDNTPETSESLFVASRLALLAMGCSELMDHPFGACSQGERQRILLARSLVAHHEMLVLDEPASGLDLPAREALVMALDDLATSQDPPTILHIAHLLEELPSSTSHALLLRNGRIIAAGPVEEVLVSKTLSECYGVNIAVEHRDGRWSAYAMQGVRSFIR